MDEKWEFDYPWQMVQIGFWMWMVSDFQKMPTQSEVMSYDSRWITDMQLAYKIYAFYKNDSPLFNLLEQGTNGATNAKFTEYSENTSQSDWAAANWQTFMDQVQMGNIQISD